MTEEELPSEIKSICLGVHTGRINSNEAARLIFDKFKQANYVQLDPDQRLPLLPKQYRKSKYISDVYGDGWRNGYTWLRNKIKESFRKVILPE